MLEKIGLPAKPSLRGNNWVVDATNCQGCSSQFTFINRKHHCRRCGGLFCNSCTQWRMLLRGQGDSPVRICEPCKKLEEAARFELRHGHKNRTGRGSAKMTSKNEDDVLNQILGNDGKESFSGLSSSIDMVSSIQRAASSGSSSSAQEVATHDGEPNHFQTEMGSTSPEELRQRALDEKKKYKILKGDGKSEEALRAFKRGKELERQADALEISIRKNRKRVLPSVNMDEIQNKEDDGKESGRKSKLRPQKGEDKDDFASELREMGLSVMDLHGEDKKSASMSLESELFSLLGDISQKTNKNTGTHGIDKTEVVALKKKALALKREGKLAEAKEELKKAKVLEKQLEEQELLAGADDSDDELSALIGSMDDDKQDFQLSQYDQERNLDFDHFVGIADDIAVDSNFEVTDEDMEDPEVAAALTSLGWTDDSNHPEIFVPQSALVDREALLSEILSLKREALNQKRAGHVAEAMAQLKKAKLLERDLESFDSQSNVQKGSQTADKSTKSAFDDGNVNAMKGMASKVAPKSRLTIQKELLALKKKALALRREGRLDESEEELNKGKVLEQQLEEMDNASNMKATQVTVGSKDPDLSFEDPGVSRNLLVEEREEDVTDQDLHDPTYLSLLKNLGWNNEDNELENSSMKAANKNDDHSVEITESSVTQAASDFPARASRRSKAEIQRELLGLKRKALALRRQGNTDEAEEVLTTAKALEAEMAEMEAPKMDESSRQKDKIVGPPLSSAVKKEDEEDVMETDMHDPALLSMLKSLGSKDEVVEYVTLQEKPSKQVAGNSVHSSDLSFIQSSSGIALMKPRSKGEIQRELLGLKRKALALRRKGETEEAEELLKMAKVLEAQMEELEAPKEEVPLDASKDKKSASLESLIINHEKHGDLEDGVGVNQGSHVETVGPNHKVAESLTGRVASDTAYLPRKNFDNSLVTSQLIEDNHPLLGELGFAGEMGLPGNLGTAQGTGFTPSPAQPVNMMDLLTGEDWSSSQIPAENLENKGSLGSDVFSLSRPLVQLGSLTSPHEVLGSNDDVTTEKKEEKVHADNKAHIIEAISTQSLDSQNDQNSLRQEVLARKRRAVVLKREGKLAEAREELRQAKLLEKSLEEDNPQSKTGPSGVSISTSTSTSTVPSVGQKEHGASNVAPKPLSGRDRFKLQQESLSHKRQALKLRREGRVEEAEAEFELAKALEAQLEELGTHDSKSSLNGAEAVDEVVVEDLLDPQLLSALKAIGLDDASNSSRGPERTEAVNLNAGKSENINQERVQLEERIKAEKLKAVNLKRSGKQAEALDALRRAKQYEKKLNSLASN